MDERWNLLIEEARKVLNPRNVSKMVAAADVAAAIETVDGNIYVGVSVDTACSLGVCAERNAIFHMLTNGENIVKKVVAINAKGDVVSPCGSCRELLVQVMPNDYQDIEVLLNKENWKVGALKELTPEWWI